MSEEIKEKIIDWMQQQKKSKHYFNDICHKAVPEMKMRQAKKLINELVEEGRLRYWSSGSTTLYMLPGADDVSKEEESM
jgi:hypothetical protein